MKPYNTLSRVELERLAKEFLTFKNGKMPFHTTAWDLMISWKENNDKYVKDMEFLILLRL